jgi:hypothetical protein
MQQSRFVTLFALGLIFWTPSARATLYNLNADWSDASNPTGPWTYREGFNALPHVPNWTPLSSPTPQPAWAPSTNPGNFLPAWFKATSANFDWLIGDIVVHTTDPFNGSGSGIANVLFTAPFDGFADISGLLWNARENPVGPQAWDLFVDGTLFGAGSLPSDGTITRSNPTTFGFFNVPLNAGDEVVLSISLTGLVGDFVGNNLSVDLSPVPEPGTLVLLGSGLAALGLMRRRRKPCLVWVKN